MLLQLLFHQMLHSDVQLFLQGIAAQLNNIHTVIKRAWNPGGIVGGGDKEHLAQVKGQVYVVIRKLPVLLWVQHLQQSRSGVPLEVCAQLVNLV